MKILLAGPDFEENLSIRYLSSSLLAAGHETVLAVFNSAADTETVVRQAQDADMVGLSMCFQARAREFLALAQKIKAENPHKMVVAGGHYASCAAEPLLANHPEIDLIVVHEGERSLVEIADGLLHPEERLPQIPGIAYRDGGRIRFTPQRRALENLDALPFPDRCGPIHSIAGVPTSYMMGSRGCYGSCAYCCITTLHRMAPGKRFRQRGVEQIAAEMADLFHERGTRQFVFHDDNFLVPSESANRARFAALEKALKQRGVEQIALVIKCRPADANRRVFRQLKDMGLVRVFLGIESATERGLQVLEREQSVEESVRALETCAALDISAQFTLMIFHPDSTLETLRSDIALMRRFAGNPLNFCRTEIYAGTPLEQRMITLGRARGDYLAREYNPSDPIADLACAVSLKLFLDRCWSSGSLMQNAIGLDHTAAVAKRFYAGRKELQVCGQVANWLRRANLNTIALLEEVVELSASHVNARDTAFQGALHELSEREAASRRMLISEASRLRAELDTFVLFPKAGRLQAIAGSRLRLARQAAVAVLALGLPASSGCRLGVSEMAPPPLKDGQGPPPRPGTSQGNLGSLAGTVTDPTGAMVARAKITVTNLDTKQTVMLKTDESGRFVAPGLASGRYEVKAEVTGFKVLVIRDVVLKPGEDATTNLRLQMSMGCCEYAAVPLSGPELVAPPSGVPDAIPAPQSKASLVGDVTDPQGAVVSNALVTITNTDNGAIRTVTTDNVGHYVAGGLLFGHYGIKVEAKGFASAGKTIALEPGENARADVALQIRANFKLDVVGSVPPNDIGCCEYAAVPLKTEPEEWITKKKPFTYYVGSAKDDGTLRGIAAVVYGDPAMWVQIFEANRAVVAKPGTVPAGTAILIPPRKRPVPKLVSKVLPAYPPPAREQHVWGDVVLDVTLREDGAVDQASVIDGPALLADAATTAVKQWRYQPLLLHGKPVRQFVVVVSFSKSGRVR